MSEPAGAARIIRIIDGTPRVIEDRWRLIDTAAQWEADEPADDHAKLPAAVRADAQAGKPTAHSAGPILVPLELALAHPQRLKVRDPARPIGLWLAPADDPARARELFASISLIGVVFPKFTDGRGYSTAVLLRTRLGWRGELRALGDVLQDQLYALRRVGFDSFAVRADRDPVAAMEGFAAFSSAYQGSVDEPLPAFRRPGAHP